MSSLQKPSIDEAEFIQKNWKLDIRDLSLKYSHQFINWGFIAHQIRGKQKSITKLPTWFNCDDIIYPVGLSVEQCSSEITAQYKSTIISGESLVDLTGGFGIDDFYFSKKTKQVYHCEIDQQLSDIVTHNYKCLGVNNISCVCIDSADFLNQSLKQFDWIYVDPARRSDAKGKVFLLEDCSPNVIDSLSLYFKHTNNILIKTAPILDYLPELILYIL